MNNKINYQSELEKIISDNQKKNITPSLLLHCCCAPCASHCLNVLTPHFNVTTYFFNPNISIEEEYIHRLEELKCLINAMDCPTTVKSLDAEYLPENFFDYVKGLEYAPEGKERCAKCFYMRLKSTAQEARKGGFEYFSTTLTISPLKNAQLLNELGEQIAKEEGVKWLPSDFKKKNGYLESIKLSEKYGLYRQNYCGCIFSKNNTK